MTTYYIDPTVALPGGAGSEADPFQLWSEVTFAVGNSYKQKRDTTAYENIGMSASGTSGNEIKLDCYGSAAAPLPIIDGTASYCLWFANDEYIDVDNLNLTSTSAALIGIEKSNNIDLTGVEFKGTSNYGVKIDADAGAVDTHDINIKSCNFTDMDGYGIYGYYYGEAAGVDTSKMYNIAIEDCDFTDVGKNAKMAIRFNVYPLTLRDFVVANGRRPYGITIKNNNFNRLGWRAISLNLLTDTSPNLISGNNIAYAGHYNTPGADTNSINTLGCLGLTIENNDISYTSQVNHVGDGKAILVDHCNAAVGDPVVSDGTIVRFNTSHDNNNSCPQAGAIAVYDAINAQFYYNRSYNNGCGYKMGGDRATGHVFYNNIAYNNSYAGFFNDETSGAGAVATLKNNIFMGSPYGIKILSGRAQPTEENNCFYDNSSGDVYDPDDGAWTIDATSISANPNFINLTNNFKLREGSPCIDAGVDVSLTQDIIGNPVPARTTIDIGAYEMPADLNKRGFLSNSAIGLLPVASGWDTDPTSLDLCTDGYEDTSTGIGNTVMGAAGDIGNIDVTLHDDGVYLVSAKVGTNETAGASNCNIYGYSKPDGINWERIDMIRTYYSIDIVSDTLFFMVTGKHLRFTFRANGAGTFDVKLYNITAYCLHKYQQIELPMKITKDADADQSIDIILSLPADKRLLIDHGDGNKSDVVGPQTTTTYTVAYADAAAYEISISGNLEYITYFKIISEPISVITQLERMVRLEKLYLYDNSLTDIGVVTNCVNLERLAFGGNSLTNIGIVTDLVNLTYLSGYNNSLTNIGVVTGLTNLTYLNFYGNSLTNIGIVTDLVNLTYISLGSNSLTNIGIVTDLVNLTSLQLHSNSFTTAGSIINLINLATLRLDNNSFSQATMSTYIDQAWDNRVALGANNCAIKIEDNAVPSVDANGVAQIEGTGVYTGDGLIDAGCTITYDA